MIILFPNVSSTFHAVHEENIWFNSYRSAHSNLFFNTGWHFHFHFWEEVEWCQIRFVRFACYTWEYLASHLYPDIHIYTFWPYCPVWYIKPLRIIFLYSSNHQHKLLSCVCEFRLKFNFPLQKILLSNVLFIISCTTHDKQIQPHSKLTQTTFELRFSNLLNIYMLKDLSRFFFLC